MTESNPKLDEQRALPSVEWARYLSREAALIIDLPGEQAVWETVALAERGFRPVPLYNGCSSLGMLIDVKPIVDALAEGAEVLKQSSLRLDSPPAFMLDSRRQESSGVTAMRQFDNRWSLMPQDMPSATFLKDASIKVVVVRTDRIRDDLAHVLCRYQSESIEVELCTDGKSCERVKVRRPSMFKSIFYRWSVFMGLKRNSAGGFGSRVPYIEQGSHGGTHFYGARMG